MMRGTKRRLQKQLRGRRQNINRIGCNKVMWVGWGERPWRAGGFSLVIEMTCEHARGMSFVLVLLVIHRHYTRAYAGFAKRYYPPFKKHWTLKSQIHSIFDKNIARIRSKAGLDGRQGISLLPPVPPWCPPVFPLKRPCSLERKWQSSNLYYLGYVQYNRGI